MQKQQIIRSLQEYLSSTDWMVIREFETGKKMPEAIRHKRADVREKLSYLKSTQ